MTVERFPGNRDSLEDGVRKLADKFKADPRWVPQGEVVNDPVKLIDGTPANLLTIELLSKDGLRRALQLKLMTLDKSKVGWVVGGYIVARQDSPLVKPDSKMAGLLRAHVLSFSLDPQRLNDAPLVIAYQP